MESVLSAATSEQSISHAANARLFWPWEAISIGLFSFLALLALLRQSPGVHFVTLLTIPVVIAAAVRLESLYSKPWTRILREWLSLGVILIAYWCIEWFSTSVKLEPLQNQWLGWDRILLHQWGLQRAVESLGPVIPFTLESAYLLLYAMPPLALATVQLRGNRAARQQLLFTLFLGTFSVYAMLPLIAVESPRRVFPGQDEPRIVTAPRQVNTYLLDHMDISTGVFPSGHVAVAFSTAFGLLGATRRTRRSRTLLAGALTMATFVFLATIYGRYHYAVDGIASIAIATVAWRLAENWSLLREI